MLVTDLLHEFELGVWKAFFSHLIRILEALSPTHIAQLNQRSVTMSRHLIGFCLN